jgi:hypothetical protein
MHDIMDALQCVWLAEEVEKVLAVNLDLSERFSSDCCSPSSKAAIRRGCFEDPVQECFPVGSCHSVALVTFHHADAFNPVKQKQLTEPLLSTTGKRREKRQCIVLYAGCAC